MKIRRTSREGENRELLLKEYFLNAYLIALLKQVGSEVRRDREAVKPEAQGTPAHN